MTKPMFLTILAIAAIVISSCSDDESTSDNSLSGSSTHNTGKNCMGCHSFKVAGSVYDSKFSAAYKNAIIKLTTESAGQGTLLATLTSDATGNYFTKNSLNFGTGVYVSITGTSGTTLYMDAAITSGACNSCHNGTITSKVWVE